MNRRRRFLMVVPTLMNSGILWFSGKWCLLDVMSEIFAIRAVVIWVSKEIYICFGFALIPSEIG